MDNLFLRPKVAFLGLSLEYYRQLNPQLIVKFGEVFRLWGSKLEKHFDIVSSALCCTRQETADFLNSSVAAGAEVVVVSSLSYTASGTSAGELENCPLPVVFWNTQTLNEVTPAFADIDLTFNHTVQGTQDVTSVLVSKGVKFSCITANYQDEAALERLALAVRIAGAAHYARKIRIMMIGGYFEGMDDFIYNGRLLAEKWGPTALPVAIEELLEYRAAVDNAELESELHKERELYDTRDIAPEIHRESLATALALEKLYRDKKVDGLTVNFKRLREDGRVRSMPFHGINRLIARGAGYAGEGDFVRAALMAELARIGSVNFTEIYPVDFVNNRMMMSHMQECNPRWSDPEFRIRLERRDFGGDNPMPYAGMRFIGGPDEVTLTNITRLPDGQLRILASDGRIIKHPELIDYHKPHWLFAPAEGSVGRWLDAYSYYGGTHHLIAIKAPLAAAAELARWHGFEFIHISGKENKYYV